ncbi:MAG TPA: aminotransferase class V-fold PLP-dependent enzyme, partial [Solirubrobacteraceae bacterium]|nr:aminotransferase class V-fold PLP-dependent enzyme [Solirubrobacteraceae bacterium]
MDAAALREAFPGLGDRAYLNAGSCGPLPRAAVRAGAALVEGAMLEGRAKPYFEATLDLRARLRAAYAAVLGADEADVALTTCTSEGMVRVLLGLGLERGDEVLTAPDEHPGLLGPRLTLRDRAGVEIRTAPLGDLPDAVGPRTRLVACSHVSWITGEQAPAALAGLPDEVPVLLDGAQGVGAVPADVAALGCAFYGGAGQKWLCGPVGAGMLWVAPAWRERLAPAGLTYPNLEEPSRGLEAAPWPDARRHDSPALSAELCAAALAAHDVLAEAGWQEVHERGTALAESLAARLAERGLRVAPRGRTTLV